MGCCIGGDTRVSPAKVPATERVDDGFDGPLKDRGCTDIIFLILFLAFIGGMGYTAYASFLLGNPNIILYGVDSWGNVCNQKNDKILNITYSGQDTTGMTKTFYYNFLWSHDPINNTVVMCVKTCPNETMLTGAAMKTFAEQTGSKLCRYDLAPSSYHAGSGSLDTCPSVPVVPHTNVLFRCVPSTAVDAALGVASGLTSVLNAIDENFADKVLLDVEASWREVCYLMGIGTGTAFLITVLMRFFAAIIIWTLVIGCALGALAGTGFCWYTWYTFDKALSEKATPTDDDKDLVERWLIISCVVSGVALIVLLILLIMRSRIGLVVQLFREAGKAIAKMPLILLQPIWTLIILLGATAGLIYIYLYVETAKHPYLADPVHQHVGFNRDEVLKYLKWYYIFGIFWITQFIIAAQQMTIAGAIATWYFKRDKSSLGWPIAASIGRLIRYHLGTLAFGSFIIALVMFARLVLSYIESKLKGGTSKVVSFLLKCLQCCLWCFEKFLKFLNRNAYILTAIYGYNFCKAAQKAFSLILSNALRVAAINSVGDFCLFLGKCGTTAIVVVVGIELLKTNTALHYMWVPIVLGAVFAFFISHVFLSVYEMAIDTIFLCFCEDCERNDGSDAKPYYMSIGLMEYVEDSDEAIAKAKARENRPQMSPTKGPKKA